MTKELWDLVRTGGTADRSTVHWRPGTTLTWSGWSVSASLRGSVWRLYRTEGLTRWYPNRHSQNGCAIYRKTQSYPWKYQGTKIFFLNSWTNICLSYLFSIRRHQERRAILTPILTDFSVRITGAPAIIFTKIISPENLHTEVRAEYKLEFNLSNGVLCLCRGELTASACLTSN